MMPEQARQRTMQPQQIVTPSGEVPQVLSQQVYADDYDNHQSGDLPWR